MLYAGCHCQFPIRCTGSEFHLSSCAHATGNTALACGHGGDVGVECNAPNVSTCDEHNGQLHDVRTGPVAQTALSNCLFLFPSYQVRIHTAVDTLNSAITRSYPEIMGSAGWGMLCYDEDSSIGNLVGEVICRQTQNLFLLKITRGEHPEGYSGRAFYNGSINCTGDESKLSECTVKLVPSGQCPGYNIINCTMGTWFITSCTCIIIMHYCQLSTDLFIHNTGDRYRMFTMFCDSICHRCS